MNSNRRPNAPESAGAGAEIPLDVLPLHSTNLLTVLDAGGTIQYESPSIERIYGYGQAELVGEQVAEYVHPEEREAVMKAFQAVVESEDYTVEAVEYRHRQADGTHTWVESVASANPTPNGNYVVNTRDVSDRKQREQQLERMNERLEAFASMVSHDLRNPLNVAQGRLELAQETDCESRHLADVEHAHSRMETLIEELLSLSRAGKQISETESVSVASLSNDCWGTVATADGTLVVATEQRLQADRHRLQQLLENLFRNAIEHTDGGVTVTVGDLDTEAGFYVEDDGPGIPPDERRQLFEAGTSTTQDGTGLGLSIVKQIVDAHGWTIRITEGSDGGARFEITAVDRG